MQNIFPITLNLLLKMRKEARQYFPIEKTPDCGANIRLLEEEYEKPQKASDRDVHEISKPTALPIANRY